MLNVLTGAALVGNYYFYHQEFVKTMFRLREKEKRPILSEEDDFGLPKDWEPDMKNYLNSIVKDCEKKPEIKITDNKTYRGDFKKVQKEKVPNGKGFMEIVDGRKLIGTFQNGELNGQGGVVDDSGSKIMGTFKNGYLDGLGSMLNAYGKTYIGHFKEGSPHGKGKWIFKDGSFCLTDTKDEDNIMAQCYESNKELFYKGDYKNFGYTGKGKYYFENGESYEGEMVEGKVEGYGIRKDKYGDEMYRGQFSDNLFIGKENNNEFFGYIGIGVLNIVLSLLLKRCFFVY